MKIKSRFNPVLQWKRRKAAKELRTAVVSYVGYSNSLLVQMRKLYKDRWDGLADAIVGGEKPSVMAEGITYEFLVWILDNSLRGDEKGKATMRETIETSKLKDRLPLFHTLDSYLVSVLKDRVGLLESLRELNLPPDPDPEISEELRDHVQIVQQNLSDELTKILYDFTESNRAKVFWYLNRSGKIWRLNLVKAITDFNKSDQGELALTRYHGLLSGAIEAEDFE